MTDTPESTVSAPERHQRPCPPRVYNYLTGESDHYSVDRDFAQRLLKVAPWLPASARINQRQRTRALLTLAQDLGIKQVIDIGCGYPSGSYKNGQRVPPHTDDIVRTIHKSARVVYVDNDPTVFGFAKTILDEHSGTRALHADAREIAALLGTPCIVEFLDLEQPIGVLLHDVLPWMNDAEATATIRALHSLLPAGSTVSITHATPDDDPAAMAEVSRLYEELGVVFRPRTRDQIASLLGPWTLLPPGIERTGLWRLDQPPIVPEPLRAEEVLPARHSHAYAAVMAPKQLKPAPVTSGTLLQREPDRAPGTLLLGAYLRALREKLAITPETLAERLVSTPLAVDLWEAGSNRLTDRYQINALLRALDLCERDTVEILQRLLPVNDTAWSREALTDHYPGNVDRAHAALRASTHVRAFTVDRIPEPFHTPEFTSMTPVSGLIGPEPGSLPSVAAPSAEHTDSCTWDLVLDEASLHRPRGNAEVMAGQLNHLLDLDRLPHISVRVLLLDNPFAMPCASLTEHTLPGGTLWRADGFSYTGLGRGSSHRLLLDRALEHAEPEARSRAIIERARDRMYSGDEPWWAVR